MVVDVRWELVVVVRWVEVVVHLVVDAATKPEETLIEPAISTMAVSIRIVLTRMQAVLTRLTIMIHRQKQQNFLSRIRTR